MPWYNPTDPKQRNWMLGGIVALGAIIPFNMYLLSPRQAENETLQGQLDQLEQVNRRAEMLSAQGGGDLEQRLALYERLVDRLEDLIPARDEVTVLLNDIQARARLFNVQVPLLEPQPPEQVGAYYVQTAYNMAAVGEYHSVARFLTEIANLPRIVTPVQVDIEPFQADPNSGLVSPIRATFRIETYVVAETPAQQPADGGGA